MKQKRRRNKQIEFNELHGITPRSAVRQVIKGIDTGEVLSDDQIDEKLLINTRQSVLMNSIFYLIQNCLQKHIGKLEKRKC